MALERMVLQIGMGTDIRGPDNTGWLEPVDEDAYRKAAVAPV